MDNKISNIFKGDKVVWMVFFLLCMVSIVEVFSASSQQTYKSQNYIGPIVFHASTIIAGFVAAIAMIHIPCRYFKLFTLPLLPVSFLLLIVVLVMGETINGANRSLQVLGFSVQPSELAKGAVVLASAQILSAMQRGNKADPKAFKWIIWITIIACVLIGLENLSTAALLFSVVYMMMIIGRVGKRYLIWTAAFVITMVVTFVSVVLLFGQQPEETTDNKPATEQSISSEKKSSRGPLHRLDTWKGRILSFRAPSVSPQDYDLNGKGAQKAHASIAIASSNIIGIGPGKSVERDYLPQAYSDFIYAIIIEELGLEGAIFVAFLYVILLFRGMKIAKQCENYFPAFLVMGLTLLLVVQAVFNMMVAVGLAPVTGQPLPLISKGGTSTIINCTYIGVILSISRTAKIKKAARETKKHDENSAITK